MYVAPHGNLMYCDGIGQRQWSDTVQCGPMQSKGEEEAL
jgi:hypothetical protein